MLPNATLPAYWYLVAEGMLNMNQAYMATFGLNGPELYKLALCSNKLLL